jgi:lipopolysaccharide transport system ATP-binding protein
MSEVAKGGRTVLFVSHNLAAIHAMCHSVLLLTRGRVACAGGADESIAHYVRMSAGMSTTRLADRTDRTGSGAVRFTAVEVLAGSNERANVVPNNAPFTLRLRYQNTLGRDLRFVLVAVGIDDEHGVRVTQLNSDVCGCSLKTVPAAAEAFDIHVKRLPLAAGRYGLTLWCSVNGEIADWLTAEVECLHVFDGGFFRRGRQPLAGQGRLLVEHRFSCCASRS